MLFQALLLLASIAHPSLAFPLAGHDLQDDVPSLNGTSDAGLLSLDRLAARSIHKRDVKFQCKDPSFSGLLSGAFQDAADIMDNMVKHLDLAIGLYNDDGSGEFKTSKATRDQRTFDEHNAWATYTMIVSKIFWTPGDSKNQAGFNRLKKTRAIANHALQQYRNYASGTPVPWTSASSLPNINVFCGEDELYSETDEDGRTFTEVFSLPNPDGQRWWLMQLKGTPVEKDAVWIQRLAVCADSSGAATRYGGVPADGGIKAYVYKALFELVAETMVFCQPHYLQWIAHEALAVTDGVHYRDLHVAVGSEPSQAQISKVTELMSDSSLSVRWLGGFLVQTLLHEATHAEAFAGKGDTLVDVNCYDANGDIYQTSVDPGCMALVAKGTHNHPGIEQFGGHKNAESFSKYAMAVYANAAFWYKGYKPKQRANWN